MISQEKCLHFEGAQAFQTTISMEERMVPANCAFWVDEQEYALMR
jgi:hypothetical protein